MYFSYVVVCINTYVFTLFCEWQLFKVAENYLIEKKCSFDLPKVPFVNDCQLRFIMLSLLVFGAEYNI